MQSFKTMKQSSQRSGNISGLLKYVSKNKSSRNWTVEYKKAINTMFPDAISPEYGTKNLLDKMSAKYDEYHVKYGNDEELIKGLQIVFAKYMKDTGISTAKQEGYSPNDDEIYA